MSLFPSFGEISLKAKKAFLRFPITLVWVVLGTLYVVWFIEAENDIPWDEQTPYIKIILIASLGVSWLISTRFLIDYFTEKKQQNKLWLIVLPLVFLGWYYWYLPNNKEAFENIIYGYKTTLYFIAGHLFIFFSPFLFTWNKNAFWNYLKTIVIAIARSILFSLVLYLGLVLALLALKYLFKIAIDNDIYVQLFVFCLGIINTWIFLSDFPQKIHNNLTISYPKALEVFVKYILIPLAVLYLIILYAYSLKILINWSLPKGWVSYLVIALSILGFIIHFLINPIKSTIKSRMINRFYPWFYVLLIPMLALLFIAIYKRISDYGFTENRYFVLILACWILGMTMYILFSKRKQLRYFPMIIMFISLLTTFGFWGAFSVSKKSQLHQFKEVYESIKANNFKITSAENDRFSSIIRYLSQRKALDKTNSIIGFNPQNEFGNISDWSIATKISDTLGIKVIYDKNYPRNKNGFISINENSSIFDIKDYDYFKKFHFNGYKKKEKDSIMDYLIYLDYKKLEFLLLNEENYTYKIDLKSMINILANKQNGYDIPLSLVTAEKEFEDINVKLIFENLNIDIKNDSTLIIRSASAYVFIKMTPNAQQD